MDHYPHGVGVAVRVGSWVARGVRVGVGVRLGHGVLVGVKVGGAM